MTAGRVDPALSAVERERAGAAPPTEATEATEAAEVRAVRRRLVLASALMLFLELVVLKQAENRLFAWRPSVKF